MGAYTTVRVRRSTAREHAMRHVLQADDVTLEGMMDVLMRYDNRLYSVVIVGDDEEHDEYEVFGNES